MSDEATYTNPIVAQEDLPDPGVAKIGELYYLVATGGGPEGGAFRMLRSEDLVHWESCGQVFSKESLPCWSGGAHGQKCDYWAPEIHQLPDSVAVFFSAREPAPNRALHVGLALAPRAEGPYRDLGAPLVSDPHWAIDPSYFRDESGRQFVLWKVDGNAHKVPSVIKIRELEGLALVGPEVELLRSDQPWEGGVVEGPYLVKRGAFYYLFYSGECYANHRYCVAVARSSQVLGPYEKSAAPMLSSGYGWAGPGHCVVLNAGPTDVMIFHAWPSASAGGRGERGKGRQVLMEAVQWDEDGWPMAGAGVPSTTPQPLPRLAPLAPARPLRGSYRLRVAQDWPVYLGYEALTKSKDQVWQLVTGLAPGGTVSLTALGKLLRHREGRLELGVRDGSRLFDLDSSWMALPGFRGGISLRSVNFPDCYVRHKDGKLFIESFQMDETYLLDASWSLEAA